jgi:O-antigen/teichoic acid export membrane protein
MMIFYQLITYLSGLADQLVILSLAGAKALGIYSIAITGLNSMIVILITSLLINTKYE